MQPAPKASWKLVGLNQDGADAIAQPPAGPMEDEEPAAVSGSDTLLAVSAEADTGAVASPAGVATAALALASPQPSSATCTQSHKSHVGPCPGTAVQDTLQSAEFSGSLSYNFLLMLSRLSGISTCIITGEIFSPSSVCDDLCSMKSKQIFMSLDDLLS